MGSFFGSGKKAAVPEGIFLPFSKLPQKAVRIPREGGSVVMGSQGSQRWFNPKSASARKLYLAEPVPEFIEADFPQALAKLGSCKQRLLVYQNWRATETKDQRLYSAATSAELEFLGKAVKGSPIRDLLLVGGGFAKGAIRSLGQALQGHTLQYLGLGWVFSGDDITDDPNYAEEIGEVCAMLKVERLCLLTGAFTPAVEAKLVESLQKRKLKIRVGAFENDDASRYKQFPTPRLAALNT